MIEEQGRVVAANEREVWVQTLRQSACNACAAQKACGQKLLNSMSSGRAQQLKVENRLSVSVGDEVVVGIPESALLKASLVLYLVPLLAMIAAALGVRELVSSADGWVMLGGFSGLGAGFWLARQFSLCRQTDQSFHPRLLRRVAVSNDPMPVGSVSGTLYPQSD